MSRQVRNENLNSPLHRGGSADLDREIARLSNAESSPIHDSGNSVTPSCKCSETESVEENFRTAG